MVCLPLEIQNLRLRLAAVGAAFCVGKRVLGNNCNRSLTKPRDTHGYWDWCWIEEFGLYFLALVWPLVVTPIDFLVFSSNTKLLNFPDSRRELTRAQPVFDSSFNFPRSRSATLINSRAMSLLKNFSGVAWPINFLPQSSTTLQLSPLIGLAKSLKIV